MGTGLCVPLGFDLETTEVVCPGHGLDPGMVLDLIDQSILIREERSGRA
ncbi:hypothetical protein ABN028_24420 [Actinopolymorpha sp. B17G11]